MNNINFLGMCIAKGREHKAIRETSYALPIKCNSKLLSSTQLGRVRMSYAHTFLGGKANV